VDEEKQLELGISHIEFMENFASKEKRWKKNIFAEFIIVKFNKTFMVLSNLIIYNSCFW